MVDGQILDMVSNVVQFCCDPLFLSRLDNPNIMFTNAKLDRSYFLSWSQSIKLALGVKAKLKFIDDTHSKYNPNPMDE